jgi:6-phospho-beta-glucosidase
VKNMPKHETMNICFVDTYEEAIQEADFVLIQFRQGGIDARIEDEKLGLKYQLPFTETISVCGFATFLRTYPVIEKLAGLIQKLAPHAWVMNFTNPAGQIAETFSRLGCQKVVGVCNSALSVQDYLAKKLGAAADEIFMNWRGLNHLTFTDAVYYKGKNYFPEMLDKLEDYSQHLPFPVDLIRVLGFLPNGYLQYYYLKDHIIQKS